MAAILYYACMYACMGLSLPSGIRSRSVTGILLSGFSLYYTLFEIIALPMKAFRAPLKALSIIWAAVCLLVVLFVLLRRRKEAAQIFASARAYPKRERLVLHLYFLLFLVISVILILNANHLTLYDLGYYVGAPVTSVKTGTIELYDVFTGEFGNDQFRYYLLNTGTAHSAVLFQLFNVHPLIEANVTLTAVGAGMLLLTLYGCGRALFGSAGKAVGFGTASVFVLYFLYSLSGTAMYFYFRPYEGKAMCSYLFPLMVLYFFSRVTEAGECREGLAGSFLLAVGSIAFTNSAMFILPVMHMILYVPYILVEKRWKLIVPLCVLLIPDAVWFALNTFL